MMNMVCDLSIYSSKLRCAMKSGNGTPDIKGNSDFHRKSIKLDKVGISIKRSYGSNLFRGPIQWPSTTGYRTYQRPQNLDFHLLLLTALKAKAWHKKN